MPLPFNKKPRQPPVQTPAGGGGKTQVPGAVPTAAITQGAAAAPTAQQGIAQTAPGLDVPGVVNMSGGAAPMSADPLGARGDAGQGPSGQPYKSKGTIATPDGRWRPGPVEEQNPQGHQGGGLAGPKIGPGAADPYGAIEDQWAGIMADQDASLNNIMTGISSDESMNARRAAEMNAGMGGSVGGGFQGGQIQAQLSGTVARADATAEANIRNTELKMTYLDRMIEMAEKQGDRDLARELQAERDALAKWLMTEQAKHEMSLLQAGLAGDPDGERPPMADSGGEDDEGEIWGENASNTGPAGVGSQPWDQYSADDWLAKIVAGGGYGKSEKEIVDELNGYLTTLKQQGVSANDLEDAKRYLLMGYQNSGGTWPNISEEFAVGANALSNTYPWSE